MSSNSAKVRVHGFLDDEGLDYEMDVYAHHVDGAELEAQVARGLMAALNDSVRPNDPSTVIAHILREVLAGDATGVALRPGSTLRAVRVVDVDCHFQRVHVYFPYDPPDGEPGCNYSSFGGYVEAVTQPISA